MKTIFVPTDFSEYTENVLWYAAALAEALQARLVLFHAYWVPEHEVESLHETTLDRQDIHYLKMKEHTILLAESNLAVLKAKVKAAHPGITIEIALINGLPVDEIVRQAQKQEADFIVMGTKGASGLKELVLGSNTADVIEHSNIPILAIPGSVRWSGLNNIVFATNFQANDLRDVAMLAELAAPFGATITILHAEAEAGFWNAHTDAAKAMQQFKTEVEEQLSYRAIQFKILESDEPYQALQKYIRNHPVDVLAMATHRRSTIQKMLGNTSLTRKMAYHTQVPLLAFNAGK